MTDKDDQQAKPDSVGVDSLPKARRDEIDLGNEMAGRETGRAARFLSPESRDEIRGEGKDKRHRKLSALLLLLQDPAYARAYEHTRQTLDAAREATELAKHRLEREAGQAAERLETIRASAAELPDGRKVYRSGTDGRFYTEDGLDVTDRSSGVSGLTDASPTWEEFDEARRAVEDIAARRRDVEDYETEILDPARKRLDDHDNPPSLDELDEIRRRLEANMPEDVRADYERPGAPPPAAQPGSVAAEYLGDTALKAPDATGAFQSVRAPETESPGDAPLPTTTPKPP